MTPPLSLKLPPVEMAHLEVPLPSPPGPSHPAEVQPSAGISDLGIQGTAGANAKALLSLSVDPGPALTLIELPPGNRPVVEVEVRLIHARVMEDDETH